MIMFLGTVVDECVINEDDVFFTTNQELHNLKSLITGFDWIVVPCDFLSFFVVFYSLIRSVIYTKNIK